jgi:hypothetical protein
VGNFAAHIELADAIGIMFGAGFVSRRGGRVRLSRDLKESNCGEPNCVKQNQTGAPGCDFGGHVPMLRPKRGKFNIASAADRNGGH